MYLYNGLGTVVGADYEQIDLRLTYHQGDADGDYEGFDRFGRIIDQWWDGYGSLSDADRFHYAYDRNSNPTYRDIDSAIYPADIKDQVYTYDGLDRLKTWDQGQLAGSTITDPPFFEQDFTLDQLGNWASFLDKAKFTTTLDQDRTHNDANEITAITETSGPSWIDPVTDASGNMTEGPAPGDETTKQKYIYDAWNRLVKVTDASDVSLGEYEYDGLNRRIINSKANGCG